MAVQIFISDTGHLKGLRTGHEGIFGLLGKAPAHMAVHDALQSRPGDPAGERRPETVFQSFGIHADAGLAPVQGILHFLDAGSQTGPDAHAGNDDPSHIIFSR